MMLVFQFIMFTIISEKISWLNYFRDFSFFILFIHII